MRHGVLLLTSLGVLLLACHPSPGPGSGGPYREGVRAPALSIEQWPPYGPVAGMPHAQAVAIFTRNRPALLRLPGVTNVTLHALGILVQTDQPDHLPADVEGLPVLDVQNAIRIAQGRLGYFPAPRRGTSEASAPAPLCQALPKESSSADVALHVGKIPDHAGIVCVRAINGKPEGITCGLMPFRLQKKEESTWRDAVFHDAPNIAGNLLGYTLQPGDSLDRHLPGFGRTASPGLYRACFRFWRQGEEEERCSQAFSLP